MRLNSHRISLAENEIRRRYRPAGGELGATDPGSEPDTQPPFFHVAGARSLGTRPRPLTGLRPIQLSVDQRPTRRRGVRQEHPRSGSSRFTRRCRSTVGPPRQRCCLSSGSRFRRRSTTRTSRHRSSRPPRLARHRAARRSPRHRSSAAVASRPGWRPRPPRPASSRSCVLAHRANPQR